MDCPELYRIVAELPCAECGDELRLHLEQYGCKGGEEEKKILAVLRAAKPRLSQEVLNFGGA